MTDREKAIRILEGKYKNFVLCHNGELLTVNELIALLKAQQPRVMTLEEVKRASGHDLFLEISGYPDKMPYMTAITLEGIGIKGISVYGNKFDFGRYNLGSYGWRCWTSRPDEKVRAETAWGAHERRT